MTKSNGQTTPTSTTSFWQRFDDEDHWWQKRVVKLAALIGAVSVIVGALVGGLRLLPDIGSEAAATSIGDSDRELHYPAELDVNDRGYWWVEKDGEETILWDYGGGTGGGSWVWVTQPSPNDLFVSLTLETADGVVTERLATRITDSLANDSLCEILGSQTAFGNTLSALGDVEVNVQVGIEVGLDGKLNPNTGDHYGNECGLTVGPVELLASIHQGGSALAFAERVKSNAVTDQVREENGTISRLGGTENLWFRSGQALDGSLVGAAIHFADVEIDATVADYLLETLLQIAQSR